MKRLFLSLVVVLFVSFFLKVGTTYAQVTPFPTEIPPQLCGCPPDVDKIYSQQGGTEKCISNGDPATAYSEFQANPTSNHLWIEDAEVTAQGKANDRARQFIFWVMTHNAIDNHPVLFQVWQTTRNLSYFFLILSAALLGLGIIIGQRTNFATDIKIWPSITKILIALVYISFSATLIVTVIQLSEIVMKFFVENLGGKDLFNIYFSGVSQERNYVNFVGCRDLNIRVQESVKTEMLILRLTNLSYYFMGGMLILRKIILWFLLFVSPFLMIFMFFSFIKNVGWVWVGVFFQWVFYGPLLALFLGALATIWKAGIPFLFDFSRSGTVGGYIYPTAINILYGGPAQTLSASNNGNYIDTFVEYIVTLVMLWAVTIFPWFLLRTFRDYCCDGIAAIKNILISNLNKMSGPPPQTPSPVAPALSNSFGASMQMPREMTSNVKNKIETIEEIKRANTDDIVRSLDIKASNLSDIANFETNKATNQAVTKNINYLKNPTQASSANEKLKYMNLRSELSIRAAKSDTMAKQVINSFLYAKPQQIAQRQSIIATLPKAHTITNAISVKVKVSQEKVQAVSNSMFSFAAADAKAIADIAAVTNVSAEKVKQTLDLVNQNIDKPLPTLVQSVSDGAKIDKEKVTSVIKEFSKSISKDTAMADKIAKEQNIDVKDVQKVVTAQMPIISDPEKNIDQTVAISSAVTIDEYEQVKKMWINHYEKGDIPVAENIRTREEWADQDIVLITNTLNKLLSEDKALKEEALDEIGFILPIFLVNSLSGEQLVTYLKAKVEAAKEIKELQLKEKEITAKLKAKSEDNMVEVDRPKVVKAEKTMEMREGLEIPEEKKI